MKPEKIKKIKNQLEKILYRIIKEAKAEGVDVESEEFKRKIEITKRNILQRLNVGKEEYDSVEHFLQREREEIEKSDVDKDILAALQGMSADKAYIDLPQEMMRIKIRVAKVEGRIPKWQEIQGKPRMFDQSQIKELPFTQLKHTDEDHRGIKFQVNRFFKTTGELSEKDFYLEKQIDKVRQEFLQTMAGMKINHADILGVTPDDHHLEKHTLESHIADSEWYEKFKRLISGGYVDDLHKHYTAGRMPWEMEAAFGGWITSNDNILTGQHYIEFTEISKPSTPASDKIRLYAKDSSGTTKIYTLDSDGTETELGAGAGGGLTILEATGDVDDSNLDFTFASKPTIIVVNGASYRENHGWSWTAGTLTATLDSPVGTGGDIYGL